MSKWNGAAGKGAMKARKVQKRVEAEERQKAHNERLQVLENMLGTSGAESEFLLVNEEGTKEI